MGQALSGQACDFGATKHLLLTKLLKLSYKPAALHGKEQRRGSANVWETDFPTRV
jgi:hypothetical protein